MCIKHDCHTYLDPLIEGLLSLALSEADLGTNILQRLIVKCSMFILETLFVNEIRAI